jgi:hypothetical protein
MYEHIDISRGLYKSGFFLSIAAKVPAKKLHKVRARYIEQFSVVYNM